MATSAFAAGASVIVMICSEAEMKALGARLIGACESGGIITLSGSLGTGKTTLVRGALEAAGITTGVRSPTYTLIEQYPLSPINIAHFDLYRLSEPEELEYLGFRDYLNAQTLCLIEWPEHAGGMLDNAGLKLRLEYQESCREVTTRSSDEWGQRLESIINLK